MGSFYKKWVLFMPLLAAALLLFAACADGEEEAPGVTPANGTPAGGAPDEVQTDFGVTDTEIRLGMTIVQSGNRAAVYAPVAPAMEAYFAKVNEEDGGVCDREIVLLVEDDQYSPAQGLEAARKLIEQDGILAFVGNLGAPPVGGQVDYINEQEVPHLWVSTGASKWGDYETWPWTTVFIPDYVSEGRILATYVNENFPDQTAAILHQNDDFGGDGARGFQEVFEGEVVSVQTYESTATDISSQLATLRAANPDILYLYSTPVFTAQAFAYMQANNWRPQVIQSYVNPASTLATLAGGDAGPEAGFQAIAGTISTNYLLDPVADAHNPALAEHERIMSEYGGPPVTNLSIYAQALAETAVETLRIACDNGDLTRAGVMRAAESLQGFAPSVILPGITIDTSETDHFAIGALVPTQIEADGTLTPLGDPISVAAD
jgi:branched-chain amino acid transport system substrate-binding protein